MAGVCDSLVAEILDSITSRYVVNDSRIPGEILKLKDEVMGIYAKLHSENCGDTAEYERRLNEIRELLGA